MNRVSLLDERGPRGLCRVNGCTDKATHLVIWKTRTGASGGHRCRGHAFDFACRHNLTWPERSVLGGVVEKARLDPEGTAKGKTILTAPVMGKNGPTFWPGPASTHVDTETGVRTSLQGAADAITEASLRKSLRGHGVDKLDLPALRVALAALRQHEKLLIASFLDLTEGIVRPLTFVDSVIRALDHIVNDDFRGPENRGGS